MKIVQINAYCGIGSTGKICKSISQMLTENSIENYILYTQHKIDFPNAVFYGKGQIYTKLQSLKSRILGNNGFNSIAETKQLLQVLDSIEPDIIHLHNLHAQNCNLELLFNYIKKKKIKVVWTLHDCWAFTAYCYYFDMICCNKWTDGCWHCPLARKFSWFRDRSQYIWKKKKKNIEQADLTITTPSKWLAEKAAGSFFSQNPICVINNGINLNIFTFAKSDLKKRLKIKSKYVVLGVADIWDKRKGIDVFIELSEILNEEFQIILVGTNKKIDKKLPNNIISIHHTNSQEELAKYYSMADVFLNPTREEVFGLVNIEALACGTPVVTFNSGGSPEGIDESCGMIIDKNDENKMAVLADAIKTMTANKNQLMQSCINRAKKYDEIKKYQEYINLYIELVKEKGQNDDQK